MQPTVAGFLAFIRNVMGISTVVLPDDAPAIGWAFAVAVTIVNPALAGVSTALPGVPPISIYTLAVYNLGGDNLINYAPDQPGQTFFAGLRTTWNITAFVAGVVQASSDNGTSESLAVPDSLRALTLANLQNLKTPYGRTYLGFAQAYGTLWGLS